ncbi:MAG: twin-arginine translocase TatA/TatE family subunit [Thermaerobacter sp.]|nr:twin-arginine translocase TatA/TatE family subunit [Thermaerobacter sp.]
MDFFSVPHILIILLVILLLFGARRLPEIGAGLGKGISEFRRSLKPPRDQAGEEGDEQHTGVN